MPASSAAARRVLAACLVLLCFVVVSGSASVWQAAPDPPDDPGVLVLSARHFPGMASRVEVGLPAFALYGDGRVIVAGDLAGALLTAREYRLPDSVVRRLYREAYGLGLAESRTYPGDPNILDGGATAVTLYFRGGHAVTKLGMSGDAWFGRHANIEWFVDRVSEVAEDVGSPAGDRGRYRPHRLAVAVIVDESPSAAGREWTGPDVLSGVDTRVAGRCTVLTGADIARVEDLVRGTEPMTAWRSGGHTFWLRARPLLPHESGCADLAWP